MQKWLMSSCVLMLLPFTALAMEVPIYNFSMAAYSQNPDDYISPLDKNYTKPLISQDYQAQQLQEFYNHYFSSDPQGLSPWNPEMVKLIIPVVKRMEHTVLKDFNNTQQPEQDKHYAENYKEQTQAWWNTMQDRMDLPAIELIQYTEKNRAIAVNNTHARALPDLAPDFFSLSIAGQGFPFDNLQESSVWAGTPLYVFSLSKDKAWALVLTPDAYYTWVRTDDIAYVSPEFIARWQTSAKHGLAAITQTGVSIFDETQKFELSAYIGSVFPLIKQNAKETLILIPVKTENEQAVIQTAEIASSAVSQMPLSATPQHFVKIINQLIDRPYGWGGRYFFNDCSQEMKSLFTPFGIWLPRNSAQQSQLNAVLDLSKNTVEERIQYLKEKAHPLMTTIFIGGHIILYVGNKDVGGTIAPITYQNLWGLSPKARDKRYVVGHSVFLPILESYPQNPSLISHAGDTYFKLIFLDQVNASSDSPEKFVNRFINTDKPEYTKVCHPRRHHGPKCQIKL